MRKKQKSPVILMGLLEEMMKYPGRIYPQPTLHRIPIDNVVNNYLSQDI
jgi:hypothetical protein